MSATTDPIYGLASPAQVAGRSGREILQAIIDGELPHPRMSETLFFHLAEVGDGYAVFEGDPSADLLNPMGTVHGGWALTLIDSATACAAMSVLPPGVMSTTIETKANFSRPILPDTGRVRAEGLVVSRGRTIISTEAKVIGGDGKVLAHGTSTLMILNPTR
jgi:uncharacterized protein (TIGR00369 family)